jgi:Kef-type K+ transport system membrane component KefB
LDLTWSLYLPLVLAALGYAVISIVAGIMAARGNVARAERTRDIGFLVVLGIGAWTIILLLIAMFSEPDDVWDMVIITLVIVVFFAILLLVFFGLSLLVGAAGRARSRRRRVTTDEL